MQWATEYKVSSDRPLKLHLSLADLHQLFHSCFIISDQYVQSYSYGVFAA